jgi:hypothetical protein
MNKKGVLLKSRMTPTCGGFLPLAGQDPAQALSVNDANCYAVSSCFPATYSSQL